jgi:hypothetical protein
MKYTVEGRVASAASWLIVATEMVRDGRYGSNLSSQLAVEVAQALTLKKVGSAPVGVSMADPLHMTWNMTWTGEFQRIQAEQAALMRCIYGNPFRPTPSIDAAWKMRTVATLAQSIYNDRAFDRLPILADALEEAGGRDAEILAHCRQPGPHARGCWVIDLLLGKT